MKIRLARPPVFITTDILFTFAKYKIWARWQKWSNTESLQNCVSHLMETLLSKVLTTILKLSPGLKNNDILKLSSDNFTT